MIGLILKNWKLLVDVLLVAGAVILVFIWNPLGVFGGGVKLQNTANMVSEIKEIGELVTAEYYGEVIASDEEAELGLVERDTIDILGEQMYIEVKNEIFSQLDAEMNFLEEEIATIRREGKKERKLSKGVRRIKSDILDDLVGNGEKSLANDLTGKGLYSRDAYNAFILYVGKHEHHLDPNTKKYVRKEVNKNQSYVTRKIRETLSVEYDNILRYRNGELSFQNYLNQGFQSTFPFLDFYLDYMELVERRVEGKKESRKDLAMIGRGSVKAGFRFGELNEGNFVYDENLKIIHFYGFQAEILNKDINRWFIPQNRIPGFQIISERNSDFYQLNQLEQHCVDKLLSNAKRAGIVEQAQKNGEEALKEFFSLLIGDEIRKVMFHQGQLVYQSDEILKDSLIDLTELNLIDSLITKSLLAIDREKSEVLKERREKLLRDFISDLKKCPIAAWRDRPGEDFPFNYYNRHLPRLLTDSTINSNEIHWIAREVRHRMYDDQDEYQKPPSVYHYWFADSLAYIHEFNDFMSILLDTTANYKYSDRVSAEEYDQAIPDQPDDWPAFSEAQEKLILSNSDLSLSYEKQGDYLKYFKRVDVPRPTYLKYLVKRSIDLTKEIIEVDTVHHFLSRTDSMKVQGYTWIRNTDAAFFTSYEFDQSVFDPLTRNFVLDTGSRVINEAGESFRVDVLFTADTNFIDQHEYLSLSPTTDGRTWQAIKISDSPYVAEFLPLTQKTDTNVIEWNGVKYTIGATTKKYLADGTTKLCSIRQLETGGLFLWIKELDNAFSSTRFLVQQTGPNSYAWDVVGPEYKIIYLPDKKGGELPAILYSEVSDSLKSFSGKNILYTHSEVSNWDFIRGKEVAALRKYLVEQNKNYQRGPILRARRKLENFLRNNDPDGDGKSLKDRLQDVISDIR